VATIGDVAREAGVARSTVSYVLSGKRPISQATKDKVAAAIERLDFTANAGARALATSRTMSLGVSLELHSGVFNPALATYLVGLSDAARERGYNLLLLAPENGSASVAGVIASRQVDGLVLMDVVEDDPRIAPVERAGYPAVLVGRPAKEHSLDGIDLDFEGAAATLVRHLAANGHRRVVLVPAPPERFAHGATFAHRFRDSALAAAAEAAMELDVREIHSERPQVMEDLSALLRDLRGATALLMHNDGAVAALPTVLGAEGIAVPEDLSVASLHASEIGNFFCLPYSSVESRPEDVMRAAVNALVERVEQGTKPPPVRLWIPGSFSDRGSVAQAPSL
jgi:DNA-binding LacI/PurR family transcriptional regulator